MPILPPGPALPSRPALPAPVPAVLAARELVRKFGADWKKAVRAGAHARFLKERGFGEDVAFATEQDASDVVPGYADHRITIAGRG